MHRTPFALLLSLFLIPVSPSAQKDAEASGKVQVPPLSKGGIASLWYRDHEFMQEEYGPFELLNFDNVDYRIRREGVTDSTWKLTAIGNFLKEGIQYATLARLKNRPGGVLLIMFEWVAPAETQRPHGVFYHAYLSKPQLLIRTRQSGAGAIDTLEFSCADVQRRCGKLFLDTKSNQIALELTGQD
ncbi:MAG: hypothetical protein GF418_16755 [Chitinivibrionales bacterium]|nr:hypothetical protein [Chitinivibrionales bacterium]MBD3397272.1 hypothetical protein [Chitinivibrionales bacterium]